MEFFEVFLKSNTFNFLIFLTIFILIFKKINISEVINKLQKNIENKVEESNTAKKDAEIALNTAQKGMDNIDAEIKKIIDNSEMTADKMAQKVINQAQNQIEIIENNTRKVIENDIQKTKKLLSRAVAEKSIELAKNNMKDSLSSEPSFHQNLIDKAIDELEGINVH